MALNLFLAGAVSMASLVISLFFLRFWRKTHDRFFLFFSVSFLLEGLSRIIGTATSFNDAQEPLIYLIRLFAFLMIIIAIIDKNRHVVKGKDDCSQESQS